MNVVLKLLTDRVHNLKVEKKGWSKQGDNDIVEEINIEISDIEQYIQKLKNEKKHSDRVFFKNIGEISNLKFEILNYVISEKFTIDGLADRLNELTKLCNSMGDKVK